MQCKFKVGDKVILCMNSVPRSVETVVSVSGTKRVNVQVTGDGHTFDESGHMRGKDFCSWYIRHGNPSELTDLELTALRKRLTDTKWFNVPESKLRRIAAILDEVES